VTIHVSRATESLLAEAAEARGTTPDLLAEEIILARLHQFGEAQAEEAGDAPQTLAEQMTDFIGVIHGSDNARNRSLPPRS